ncbi:hypothetical protein SteCoe_34315 [Stentor coeruleus]|uniref:Uncharacterized protein n=1 Tax=Stentor coeruleus TaxID=5963 RepID=A0A1R2AUU0_9CILI|nr:hypothetical protein SteCoe_34315 [Stentor coeruleus]
MEGYNSEQGITRLPSTLPNVPENSDGSLNASFISLSYSIKSNEILDDSYPPSNLAEKNKEITELLGARVTAFRYFSREYIKNCFLTPSTIPYTLGDVLTTAEDKDLDEMKKEEITLKEFSEIIFQLNASFEKEKGELKKKIKEISEVTEEEEYLLRKLTNFENQFSRAVLEREQSFINCKCLLF